MDHSYWFKQTTNPLFPDLLWSRPENKHQAGKLLVIGGNAHGFAAPAQAYSMAVEAGAGTVHVLLPDAIKKSVGPVLENADFAPSTPSGSFAKQALVELLGHAQWSDGVLLAGELGRNSETAVLLESFVAKLGGQLVLTKDAVDYFTNNPVQLLDRSDTLLVLSLAQLQKIGQNSGATTAITFSMDLVRLVAWLHEYTSLHKVSIVTKHLHTTFVAHKGKVSTTLSAETEADDIWRVPTAATSAVWWIQNPSKPFEAMTAAQFRQ